MVTAWSSRARRGLLWQRTGCTSPSIVCSQCSNLCSDQERIAAPEHVGKRFEGLYYETERSYRWRCKSQGMNPLLLIRDICTFEARRLPGKHALLPHCSLPSLSCPFNRKVPSCRHTLPHGVSDGCVVRLMPLLASRSSFIDRLSYNRGWKVAIDSVVSSELSLGTGRNVRFGTLASDVCAGSASELEKRSGREFGRSSG